MNGVSNPEKGCLMSWVHAQKIFIMEYIKQKSTWHSFGQTDVNNILDGENCQIISVCMYVGVHTHPYTEFKGKKGGSPRHLSIGDVLS